MNIDASGTEADVCRDIATRQKMGLQKCGTTVADNPLALRAWLQHAYEETLDKAIYLKRSIQEIDKLSEEAVHPRPVNPENPAILSKSPA